MLRKEIIYHLFSLINRKTEIYNCTPFEFKFQSLTELSLAYLPYLLIVKLHSYASDTK